MIHRPALEVPEMVNLSAGEFTMGSACPDRFSNATERPAHRVKMNAFRLSRFPVTEAQWHAFSGRGDTSELPVVRVSWHEAMAYTEWLSHETGQAFRLPTEAEWEYACRADSETIFSTGNLIFPDQANYLYDDRGMKVGVGKRTLQGTYPPNAFGIEDMHGNVCEWVADVWRPGYDTEPSDNKDSPRVLRGGAWDYLPRLLRSAWRDWALPSTRRDNLGFRIACDLNECLL